MWSSFSRSRALALSHAQTRRAHEPREPLSALADEPLPFLLPINRAAIRRLASGLKVDDMEDDDDDEPLGGEVPRSLALWSGDVGRFCAKTVVVGLDGVLLLAVMACCQLEPLPLDDFLWLPGVADDELPVDVGGVAMIELGQGFGVGGFRGCSMNQRYAMSIARLDRRGSRNTAVMRVERTSSESDYELIESEGRTMTTRTRASLPSKQASKQPHTRERACKRGEANKQQQATAASARESEAPRRPLVNLPAPVCRTSVLPTIALPSRYLPCVSSRLAERVDAALGEPIHTGLQHPTALLALTLSVWSIGSITRLNRP